MVCVCLFAHANIFIITPEYDCACNAAYTSVYLMYKCVHTLGHVSFKSCVCAGNANKQIRGNVM